MVKYNDAALDRVFAALADPTRRGILAALAAGSGPVSELAQPFGMSLPGFVKHLRVLEDAGLVAREKTGRVVTCELSAAPLREPLGFAALTNLGLDQWPVLKNPVIHDRKQTVPRASCKVFFGVN